MEAEISLFSSKKSAEITELTISHEKELSMQKKTILDKEHSLLMEIESKNVLREEFLRNQLKEVLVREEGHAKGRNPIIYFIHSFFLSFLCYVLFFCIYFFHKFFCVHSFEYFLQHFFIFRKLFSLFFNYGRLWKIISIYFLIFYFFFSSLLFFYLLLFFFLFLCTLLFSFLSALLFFLFFSFFFLSV